MDNKQIPDVLVVPAFRYCLGRKTYIVQEFVNFLVKNWSDLGERSKICILRELDAAFEQDDSDRQNGAAFRTLGQDCDREQWERVRELWRK